MRRQARTKRGSRSGHTPIEGIYDRGCGKSIALVEWFAAMVNGETFGTAH